MTHKTTHPPALLSNGVRELFRTRGPARHFFGYYDKSPVSADGRWLLCHRTDFDGRLPEATDRAELGRYDLVTGQYRALAGTNSFNWQQGAMLQWLGPDHTRRVIYNDCLDGAYCAVILDTITGQRQIVDQPIYHVRTDGGAAVTLDFRRLYWARPSYAYANIQDESRRGRTPQGDGIDWVDLKTNTPRRVLDIATLIDHHPVVSMAEGNHYIEHLCLSPDGRRLAFYHRWTRPDGGWWTRLYTVGSTGQDLRLYPDSGCYSHGCWRTDNQLLYWCRQHNHWSRLRGREGGVRRMLGPLLKIHRKLRHLALIRRTSGAVSGFGYSLFDDNNPARPIGFIPFAEDGHCTFQPGNPNRFLTDTYPDSSGRQRLFLFDLNSGRRLELGSFYCPPQFAGQGYRCDLHPRWDSTGRRVCIDSLQDGTRQIYLYDVSAALERL